MCSFEYRQWWHVRVDVPEWEVHTSKHQAAMQRVSTAHQGPVCNAVNITNSYANPFPHHWAYNCTYDAPYRRTNIPLAVANYRTLLGPV